MLHPQSVTVEEGATVKLTVEVEGRPLLRLRWLRDGVPLMAPDGPELRLPAVNLDDAARYSCQVSDRITAQTISLGLSLPFGFGYNLNISRRQTCFV